MTSSLAKVNKSSGAHFRALFLKFPNFLMFLNIQIDLLILKTYDGKFTLTTKNHCILSFRQIWLLFHSLCDLVTGSIYNIKKANKETDIKIKTEG